MIEEQYVSFETAKLLKEVGFDEVCLCDYDGLNGFRWFRIRKSVPKGWLPCPSQALAAMWLREKFGIHIFTNYFFEDGTWFYVTVDLKESDEVRAIHPDIRSYTTCEEALEAGLQEAIKLIKK